MNFPVHLCTKLITVCPLMSTPGVMGYVAFV